MLMDRYLVFEISHLANIWSYLIKEGKNIQEEEKQTACLGVSVKIYWYLDGISKELEPFRNSHKTS